jgi:hypothetical protein
MRSISHRLGRTGPGIRGKRRGSAGIVAGIVFAGAIAFLAIGYIGFVLWPRHLSAVPADTPSMPITIAGVVFNVPPAAIRQAVQRRSGPQERIDLAFLWPSLEPPDPSKHAEKQAPSDELAPIDRLFVTIAGHGGTLSPAERVKAIYPRYVLPDVEAEADGLVARRFGEQSPYRGEDLVFDPAAPERFVARCSRTGATPGMCLLERRVGAADITLRFPRDWLADWREMVTKFDDLIATLRPPGR